jgi:hypothetical protein
MKSNVEELVTSLNIDIAALLECDYYHLDVGKINDIYLILLSASRKINAFKSVAKSFDELLNRGQEK